MFSGKLSPITTPPPSTDKVLRRYSRHSRDEGNLDLVEPLLNERVSADESAIAQVTIMDQELSISPASEHSSVNPTGDNESSVKEHHHNSVDQTSAVNLSQKQKGSDGEDRVVEYENPCETESSEPLTTETSSSVSVAEQDEESRCSSKFIESSRLITQYKICLLDTQSYLWILTQSQGHQQKRSVLFEDQQSMCGLSSCGGIKFSLACCDGIIILLS